MVTVKYVVRCSGSVVRCSKDRAGQFEKGYVKMAGLKGETSNELTAGCGLEFSRVRPRS